MFYRANWSPLARGFAFAFVFVLLTAGISYFDGAPSDSDLMIRLMLASAIGLVAQEAIDSAMIAKHRPRWSRRDTAMLAFIFGLTFALPLSLVGAGTTESGRLLLITWAVAGLIYGSLMAVSGQKARISRHSPQATISTAMSQRRTMDARYFTAHRFLP